jgi:hypothetical protein
MSELQEQQKFEELRKKAIDAEFKVIEEKKVE